MATDALAAGVAGEASPPYAPGWLDNLFAWIRSRSAGTPRGFVSAILLPLVLFVGQRVLGYVVLGR